MTSVIVSMVALAVGVSMVSTAAYRYITFISRLERDWMSVMSSTDTLSPTSASDPEAPKAIIPRVLAE